MTTIGDKAFYKCEKLDEIIANPTTPPALGSDVFDRVPATCVVTVPSTAFSSYKAADGWKDQTLQTTCKLGGIAYKVTSTPTANTAEVIASTSKYDGEYTIPSSITVSSLGNMTFTVTAIGEKAFYDCKDLTAITFPNTLTTIKEEAFYGCRNLSSVVIPNSVTVMERGAFNQCWGMSSITLSENLTELADNLLIGSYITTLTIPSKVTSIGKYALSSYLQCLISLPTTPPAIADETTFDSSLFSTCEVQVPTFSYKRYTEADYWKNFTNIIYDAPILDLADGDPYTVDYTYADATINYTRTFENTNWQPLYVPFSISYAEWSGDVEIAELAGVHMYEDGRNTIIEFLTVKSGELLPNVPYVVRAKQTGTVSLSLEGKTLYAAPEEGERFICCATPRWTYKLFGNYQAVDMETINSMNALVMGGGNFSSALADLKPGRFYLKKEHSQNGYWPAPAHGGEVIDIMIDGVVLSEAETDGILNVETTGERGESFNLNGIKVGAGFKGITIKNGKKFVTK